MLVISPLKEKIIRSLAEYKYLAVSHFIKLGLTKSDASCRKELRYLKERGFTGRMTSSSIPESMQDRMKKYTRIRHEDLHYLTEKGAKMLEETTGINLRDIRYPKRSKATLANDYFHRVSSVFCHIAYNKWIEKNDFISKDVLLYYDKRGKFSYLKTTIETRVKRKDKSTKTPDLVYGYKTSSGKEVILILEVYNGARSKYIHEQTKEMLEVIQETNELSKRVGIKKLPRILITCETQERIKVAVEKIRNDSYFNFERIGEMIFFNVDKAVWDDFGKGWVNIFGEVIDLEKL